MLPTTPLSCFPIPHPNRPAGILQRHLKVGMLPLTNCSKVKGLENKAAEVRSAFQDGSVVTWWRSHVSHTLTSTSLSSPQAFHLIYSSCSDGHHGRGPHKAANKLQDTFSNLGVRPHHRLLHRVTIYLSSTLTRSRTMHGLCRWAAGHAPAGCGMQASCPVIMSLQLYLFVSIRRFAANLQANPM